MKKLVQLFLILFTLFFSVGFYWSRNSYVQNFTTITASTAETSILAAGTSGVYHDLTYLKFTNTSATGTECEIRDVLAGSAIDSWYVPATTTVGGVLQNPFKQTTAASAWTAKCLTSVSSVKITVQAENN